VGKYRYKQSRIHVWLNSLMKFKVIVESSSSRLNGNLLRSPLYTLYTVYAQTHTRTTTFMCTYIQGDSPFMPTLIFSFNNEFIRIQIFGIFLYYAQRPRYFQIIDFFYYLYLLVLYLGSIMWSWKLLFFKWKPLLFV